MYRHKYACLYISPYYNEELINHVMGLDLFTLVHDDVKQMHMLKVNTDRDF